jgi:hypothetical protein
MACCKARHFFVPYLILKGILMGVTGNVSSPAFFCLPIKKNNYMPLQPFVATFTLSSKATA